MKVEFPASRVEERDGKRRYIRQSRRQALILGGDSQTQSWAQAMGDSPNLKAKNSPAAAAIGKARGAEPLRAQVFKVSHHGSKHGVNLELIEQIQPKLTLVSSVAGRGKYNFPHDIAQGLIREALDPTASKGGKHDEDFELGLLYTADRMDASPDGVMQELGTVAIALSPNGTKREVWRFLDSRKNLIDLQDAHRQTI